MSAKAIREFDGKLLLSHFLQTPDSSAALVASIVTKSHDAKSVEASFAQAEVTYPWLKTTRLVCKPDQLIKRRGKNGLLGINLDWASVKDWIRARACKPFKVSSFNNLLIILFVSLKRPRGYYTPLSWSRLSRTPRTPSTTSASRPSEKATCCCLRTKAVSMSVMWTPKPHD